MTKLYSVYRFMGITASVAVIVLSVAPRVNVQEFPMPLEICAMQTEFRPIMQGSVLVDTIVGCARPDLITSLYTTQTVYRDGVKQERSSRTCYPSLSNTRTFECNPPTIDVINPSGTQTFLVKSTYSFVLEGNRTSDAQEAVGSY